MYGSASSLSNINALGLLPERSYPTSVMPDFDEEVLAQAPRKKARVYWCAAHVQQLSKSLIDFVQHFDSVATGWEQLHAAASNPTAAEWESLERADMSAAEARIRQFAAPGVEDALCFLGLLPPGFPTPKSVCTEDDVVGLFWKTPQFYADVEFHGGGTFEIFTRKRGEVNIDKGADDISIDDPFEVWGPEFLAPLFPRGSTTA